MKCGIMQPYFLPYLGYWQLLDAVDVFVIYDDVNYIKQGYINRNSILMKGNAQRITLEVCGASSNKKINEVIVGNNRSKLLKTIEQAYSKAPEFERVFPLIDKCISNTEKNLAVYLGDIIQSTADYLQIHTKICYSSGLTKNDDLKGEQEVLEICKRLGTEYYINAIGGRELYSKKTFEENGITLSFLEPALSEYKQFDHAFVGNLSIIDVMMFNSRETVQEMLGRYRLI